MRHLDLIFQFWMGAYGIIAVLFWYKGAKYQERLKAYVERKYPQFYNEHLFAPLIVLNTEGSKRSFAVFKYIFWGEMPDEASKNYQYKAKIFSIIAFLWIFIPLFLTLIWLLVK